MHHPSLFSLFIHQITIHLSIHSILLQVQIYNQYGQFVRKFGANILQHPRGVCVDNKGRIVVVECKVMRVIIFDQVNRSTFLFTTVLGWAATLVSCFASLLIGSLRKLFTEVLPK